MQHAHGRQNFVFALRPIWGIAIYFVELRDQARSLIISHWCWKPTNPHENAGAAAVGIGEVALLSPPTPA